VFEVRVKLNLFLPLYMILLQASFASIFVEVEEHIMGSKKYQ
jgi:hypothetical protein